MMAWGFHWLIGRRVAAMRRRWPREHTYPLIGLVLAMGVPVGFAILEMVTEGPVSRLATYVYVLCSAACAFAMLGAIVGREEDQLERSSTTDALTGLANRRQLHARLLQEMALSARYQRPLALLLIDLDGLKDINDRYGHEAGDAALRTIADTLRKS
jgi:predicted signal transduction protein with EAL and GGDEF domain